MKEIEFEVNGVRRRIQGDPSRKLLSVLRDDLELTGTKYGCGEGQCGACTVLVDGRPVRSCLTGLETAAGKKVTTIEGLESSDGRLHPLQSAFISEVAMQCGYCTTGMIMSAAGLLGRNPRPSEDEIVRAMQGNICRCGTYPRIVEAVRRAAGGSRNGGRR